MILGLSSYAYGWAVGNSHNAMNERDLIRSALDFGLRCLQIGDNLPLHTFSEERIQSFREQLQKNAIRLEVGARKLTEENLKQYLDICGHLNAPLLRFVIDGDEYRPDLRTTEGVIENSLPELKERNIVLAIENHDRFKARDLAALVEKIGSPFVGICLDCVNSMGAGEGLEHVAELLAPYTVNLHLKDFKIERLSHKMGFTITGERVGKGMTNIAYMMKLLSRYDRCHSAVLEQWVPPENDLADTIEKERAWAKEGIAYLQNSPWFNKY
jgi:sugar phosphate isomerase/epimerase